MTSTLSGYNRFYADINNSLKWLILGLLLVLIQIYIVYRRKAIMKSQVMDLCLIAVTGIFGFLAVNIFPNKFFGK
jgi:TctA family transporter